MAHEGKEHPTTCSRNSISTMKYLTCEVVSIASILVLDTPSLVIL